MKHLVKDARSDTTYNLNKDAELAQLAWSHRTDSQSPYTIKILSHFLNCGVF